MENIIQYTKSRINAGMPHDNSFSGIKTIGYKLIRLVYTPDMLLIREELVKKVFFDKPRKTTAKI